MNATAAREYASKHTRVSKREKEKIKGGETISQKIENNLGRQRTGLSRAMGTGFGGEEGKEARRRGTKTWVGETRSWCVCVCGVCGDGGEKFRSGNWSRGSGKERERGSRRST